MNLKERGVTVGDLLIILIIIITSTILFKSFNKDKKTTLNYVNQEEVSYRKNYYQKFIWITYINYLSLFLISRLYYLQTIVYVF